MGYEPPGSTESPRGRAAADRQRFGSAHSAAAAVGRALLGQLALVPLSRERIFRILTESHIPAEHIFLLGLFSYMYLYPKFSRNLVPQGLFSENLLTSADGE